MSYEHLYSWTVILRKKKKLKCILAMAILPSATLVFTYSEDCVLHKDNIEEY